MSCYDFDGPPVVVERRREQGRTGRYHLRLSAQCTKLEYLDATSPAASLSQHEKSEPTLTIDQCPGAAEFLVVVAEIAELTLLGAGKPTVALRCSRYHHPKRTGL